MSNPSTCIYWHQGEQTIPMMSFQVQGSQYWIYPQHLPILIHKPNPLADNLPGLEQLSSTGDHA